MFQRATSPQGDAMFARMSDGMFLFVPQSGILELVRGIPQEYECVEISEREFQTALRDRIVDLGRKPGLYFADIAREVETVKRAMQEVKSAMWALVPAPENYRFVAYLDVDSLAMGYTVTDDRMVEVKLLSDLPATVVVALGKFIAEIEDWQQRGDIPFPYAQFSGVNLDMDSVNIRSPFQNVPSDEGITAEEAELK